MMHGPCGDFNPECPCMIEGKCNSHYPKCFQDETLPPDGMNNYVQLRRRDDGRKVEKVVRRTGHANTTVELDNRHVVPYNKALSLKYNAHINVEICASIKSIKYLFLYIYKGHDMADMTVHR
jgi:hypothetical protein